MFREDAVRNSKDTCVNKLTKDTASTLGKQKDNNQKRNEANLKARCLHTVLYEISLSLYAYTHALNITQKIF